VNTISDAKGGQPYQAIDRVSSEKCLKELNDSYKVSKRETN